MKLNLLTFLLLFLFSVGSAQDYSISNVVFDPPSPGTLMPNERVNFTFDYTKPGGDIRIFARANQISGIGSAFSAGSALYTENSGSGDAYFFYNNGATIDKVTFSFRDVDGTLLYDTAVIVDFIYHGFEINDLELTPASPSVLNTGDSIKFTFAFKIPDMDLLIVPTAMSNGNVVSKQTTSVSPSYSDTIGNGEGFIKIDSLAAVDQIRFQFLDETTNDTLVEVFKNVYYSFSNDTNKTYSISNVVFDPPSPASLTLNDRVNITFDYSKPYGDVRLDITPIKSEGSGNAGTSGSGLYSENNGSADGHFVYFGEAKVEQVRFRIQSVSGTILHEYFEDVYFTYTEDSTKTYSISNVVFDKPSPAIIHTVDTLNFTFNYSKPFGEVRIFARPMINGNLQVGSFSSTVKTYSDDTGETSDYISFVNESSFDQVRFQIKSTLNQLLFETFIDVDYTFILRPVTSEIFANVDGPDIYPVPSGGELNISVPTGTGFNYSIINLSGQIILKGFSNSNTSKIDIGNVPSGTYIAKIKYNDKQYSKLIIFE